ncbi:mRNA export factor Gle1 [Ochlerotatus camptorhynchus]|uniref:mRNA export factor Gle1 n=1 Tax=Ochlerotatus camptorhynchus TaxID=644619 RepID=UPI0031E23B7F
MSRLILDMDDILSDFQSLKLSALSNAARASSQGYGRTIGPDDGFEQERHENSFPGENNQNAENIGSLSELIGKHTFLPDLKVTFVNRSDPSGISPNARTVDISDCRAVSFKMYEQELERKRIKDMKHAMEQRQAKVREADRLRDLQFEERIKQAGSDAARKAHDSEQKLLEAIREQELIAKDFEEKRKAEIDEENRRLAEVSQQLKKKEEEIKRKHAMFDAIRNSQYSFRKMTDAFTKTLMNIDKEFSVRFNAQKKTVQGLVKSFEQLLHNVNATREVTQQEVDKAAELCKSMDQANAEVVEIMNRIQTEIADRVKKEEEQKQEQQKAADAAPVQDTAPLPQDTPDTTTVRVSQPAPNQPDPLAAFASQESRAFHREIKTFYEQHQHAVKALVDDASMKTYRFNCQKAINTPVNAISAVSREHFVDKFNKLDALLSGQPVKTGDTAVSINGHPLGKIYCTMLLAKKFVGQADTMISSNASAAFPIAAIIVGLWQKYPEFGKFFLAYLHKECPYLVPYFLPQLEGQSQEDYLKSIGYRFSDGALEKQDQYLKRMTGLARLYAAVVVSNPRRGETAPHPHSMECGWRWLCNILNLSPLPDICATLITEFLQTAGPSLWACYGKQFVKVLTVIHEQYLPALNKVDEGGPKARLEGLIAKITAEGKIDRPEGMLSPDFW